MILTWSRMAITPGQCWTDCVPNINLIDNMWNEMKKCRNPFPPWVQETVILAGPLCQKLWIKLFCLSITFDSLLSTYRGKCNLRLNLRNSGRHIKYVRPYKQHFKGWHYFTFCINKWYTSSNKMPVNHLCFVIYVVGTVTWKHRLFKLE